MKVRVQFFSRLRDLARTPAMDVEVPEQTTAADLLEIVYAKAPALCEWQRSLGRVLPRVAARLKLRPPRSGKAASRQARGGPENGC